MLPNNSGQFEKSNGDIKEMERTILSQNPHLKKIFAESKLIIILRLPFLK